MSIDFYQEYKEYSNTDLLKIVNQPTDFQPEAVAVAQQILTERVVTNEEIQFVDEYFKGIQKSAKLKSENAELLKSKVADFLEPVLHPGEKVEPDKWVNILLFAIGLQYAWTLFNAAKRLLIVFECKYCHFDFAFVGEILTLIYVPFIFLLLFKRRRWGWILLFADNLFSLILRISESYAFFKYQSIHRADTSSFLLPILIKGAFIFFLWREPITDHFRVTYKEKRNTALIVAGGTLLLMLIAYIFLV
jgi:hypothetical protein